MPIYKQTTEITNIDDLLSSVERDIEEVYFGDKQVFTVWGEYEGTLPAQYTANGDYLADYRVYGSAGGVGDETPNLFNAEIEQGSFIPSSGAEYANYTRVRSKFEDDVIPAGTYTINAAGAERVGVYVYDATKNYVSAQSVTEWQRLPFTFTINNAYYVRFIFSYVNDGAIVPTDVYNIMLNAGSTPIPYGYEVDMSVSGGTTSTTTPIYIGADPLGEDEYVDYTTGKIYRKFPNIFDISSITNVKRNNVVTVNGFSNIDNIITFALTIGEHGAYSYNSELTFEPNVEYQLDFDVYLTGTSTSNFIAIALTNIAVTALISNEYFNYEISKDSWAHVNVSLTPTESVGMLRIQARNTGNYIQLKNVVLRKNGFQPTDPPVPLPALPTVDGTTIVDYAGQSTTPSEFYAKYRKQNF